MLEPSHFARPSPELESFMKIADLQKPVGDPLTALRTLQRGIYDSFEYESGVTEVNSPICGKRSAAQCRPWRWTPEVTAPALR